MGRYETRRLAAKPSAYLDHCIISNGYWRFTLFIYPPVDKKIVDSWLEDEMTIGKCTFVKILSIIDLGYL